MDGWLLSFVLGYGLAVCLQIAMLPMRPRLGFSLKHFRALFAFGMNLGLNNLLSFAFRRTDRLLIGGMVTSAAVAAYSAANRLPTTVHKLYDAFRKVYFPIYAELHGRHAQSQKDRLTSVTISVLSFGIVLVSLIVVLFRTEIVLLIFTKEYLDSATALGLLMLPLSVGLIQNLYSATLIASDHPQEPIKINAVGMTVNLGVNLLLIPLFGFYGAIYARIAAVLIAHPAYVFFLRLHHLKGHYLQHAIPLLIAGLCLGLYYALQLHGIGTRIALVVTFVAVWAVMNRSTLQRALAGSRALWSTG
jgi:O-antigen/teichoic acid export membrane protein